MGTKKTRNTQGTTIAFWGVLLVIVVFELIKGTIDTITFVAMFGTTGIVGVCVARVLEVWKDCVKLLNSILLGTVQK